MTLLALSGIYRNVELIINLFSMQSLPSQPESLLLVETSNDENKGAATIHLNIGLQVILIIILNSVNTK